MSMVATASMVLYGGVLLFLVFVGCLFVLGFVAMVLYPELVGSRGVC